MTTAGETFDFIVTGAGSVGCVVAGRLSESGRWRVGLYIGPSGGRDLVVGFLKSLARRGLRGVKLVISDAHEGLKAALYRIQTRLSPGQKTSRYRDLDVRLAAPA